MFFLADARQVMDYVDPERAELVGVADSRELQQLRRVDRAAAQNHLACIEDDPRLTVLDDLDPDRPLAREQHLIDERVAADIEVGP